MRVRGPDNAERAVQTDPTAEQKKCWHLLAQSLTSFKLCATTLNNSQQHATKCVNGRNM